MIKQLFTNKEIENNFNVIKDKEYRELVENLQMPSYLYGSVLPEKNCFNNNENNGAKR